MKRILTALIYLLVCNTTFADPQPGDIFKEYVYKKKTDFFNGPFNHLDSVVTKLAVEDLKDAVKIEVAFYYWGGHTGTSGQEFSINSSDRYKITQPVGTPNHPECYYRTVAGRSSVEVPLETVKKGENIFTFYCGKQICHAFNWPHYWIYKYIVRIYYSSNKSCQKGKITMPASGAVIGDFPDLEAKADLPDSVARIDFLAYYKGFDIDGDGKLTDWQYQVKDAQWTEGAAVATTPRYKQVWNNYWIPDQDSAIRFMAKITDRQGYNYMTEAVEGVKLLRKDRSVKMYLSDSFPEVFGARKEQRRECVINMPEQERGTITDAKMYLSTWSAAVDNESPFHEIGVNEQVIANKFGLFHDHSLDMLPVPIGVLRPVNKIHIYSTFWGHAMEINWPGPALLVERCIKNCDVTECKIEVDTKSGKYPSVHFENDIFKAAIKEHKGAACGTEHAIRDLIVKNKNLNQAGTLIDACAQRGPLNRATVVYQQKDSAKIKLEYSDCKKGGINAVSDYTIYKGSPFIKIDYIKYPDGWWNTVDIGRPGGEQYGTYKIYGQEDYTRSMEQYPKSYWNTFDKGYETDPKDGGKLNYKGYIIMLIGDLQSGTGFGRIVPVSSIKSGGAKIVKLLNRRGFETFPGTGGKNKPYSSYVFVFNQGLEKAMTDAKKHIDEL